jgi:hypothetical protein
LIRGLDLDQVRSILSEPTVARVTIEAPMGELLAHAGSADDVHVMGRVTLDDGDRSATLDSVRISLRGHTSRRTSECDFPKLKLEFARSNRSGTPFERVAAIKVGTHCGDRPDSALTSRYGRLANEHEPWRESLVYAVLRAAGATTLLARPARITYVDTEGARPPLERNGMLLEDDGEAARRLDAGRIIDEGSFETAESQFSEPDTARLLFAEAMIGNFDWCLRMTKNDTYRCDGRHPLWNVLAMQRTSAPAIPLIYDFDLAGAVVGRHVWFDQVFDRSFSVPPSSISVEVQSQVQRTRSVFPRSTLDATRAAFMRARETVLDQIERAPVDDEGRRFAREYVTAFYDAISDEAFYRPVVVGDGHEAYADAGRIQPACGGARTVVPAGTPVGAALESRGGMVRVRVLDALWRWTADSRCDRIHRESIWIDASAIDADFPR